MAAGDVEVHSIPLNHDFYINIKHTQLIADRLRACLEKAWKEI